MKITEQDKQMIKALAHILELGSFSLKWREASAFGALYAWVKDLDKRMNIKDKEITITEGPDAD